MGNKIYCIGLADAKFACLDMPLNTFQNPVSLKYKDDELSTNRIHEFQKAVDFNLSSRYN